MFRRPARQPVEHRLVRQNGIIAGVCGGLGAYFDINPWIIRAIFVLLTLLGGFPGIIIYAILWITMPKAQYARL